MAPANSTHLYTPAPSVRRQDSGVADFGSCTDYPTWQSRPRTPSTRLLFDGRGGNGAVDRRWTGLQSRLIRLALEAVFLPASRPASTDEVGIRHPGPTAALSRCRVRCQGPGRTASPHHSQQEYKEWPWGRGTCCSSGLHPASTG